MPGFLVAAALWWVYFDFVDEAAVSRRGILGGLIYVYMHYFVVVGLTALGAGVKVAILSAGGDHHYDGTAWVLCAGLALTMLGLAVIDLVSGRASSTPTSGCASRPSSSPWRLSRSTARRS